MQRIDSPAEWLAAIVDSSSDAIVGKTLDSVIRSWNIGATQMFGYTPEEVIGQSVLILIPPELHDEETHIVSRLSHGERIQHFETVRVRKDHSRIEVSLSVSPIRDRTGRIVGAAKIARDVTETNRLRRAERELSEELQAQAVELEEQLEQIELLHEDLELSNAELQQALTVARTAQRNAEEANLTKAKFLATMSHELRTPLNAIGGYVDLLQLGLRGPVTEVQQADLERIKRNQVTLHRLVEDVLAFAKLESGHLQYHTREVAIDGVLQTLEAFFAPSLERKKIEYRFEGCPDAIAHADQDKIQQIMLNLISNALKFTEKGGITVRCEVRDPWIAVDVADTGHGIPEELLEAVFEPFVQAESHLTRTVEGTGLGLSISRQLARGMGGDVTLTSQLGRGSTFTLLLPRSPASDRE